MHLFFSLSLILLSAGLVGLISHIFVNQNANGNIFIGRNSTNGTSLDVSVEELSIHSDVELKELFKVFFFKPHTNTIQQHVDYDFLLLKDGRT